MSDETATIPALGRDILGRRASLEREPTVKLYDFKRPDKFSREQIRTVEIVHETFARLSGVSLSALLRLPCDLTLRKVDQMTYGEFMDTLAAPTVICAVTLSPWKGMVLFQYDLELREALLERGFGGAVGVPDPLLGTRELTDLECAAIEIMSKPLFGNFGIAWEQVEKLRPEFCNVETDPRFCQIVPPSEMIIHIGLEVKIGDRRGTMNIVIPYLVIEPVVFKLKAQFWYTSANPLPEGSIPVGLVHGVEAPADLIVAGGRLSIGELRALKKGSLVPIPGLDEGVGRLRVGGCEVMRFRLTDTGRDHCLDLEIIADGRETDSILLEAEDSASDRRSLERGFSGLRASLEGMMRQLGARLDEIEGKQASLSDRLAFGGADEGDTDRLEVEQRPFSTLASVPAADLSMFLASERVQATALVLAYLDDSLASRILDGLPPPMQTEVVRRLATLVWVSPAMMKETERVLGKKLASMGKDYRVPDGLQKIVGLLNLTQRATERNVIESLDLIDPELSEEIKKNMFVVEDISLLDGESMELLCERADEGDLVLALKPLDASMREKVLARLEKSEAARILARTEAMGRTRLSECDAAGQRLVAIVRQLDKEGIVAILRKGEES